MLISDTESDGFKYEATRLWCIVSYNPEIREWYISIPDELSEKEKKDIKHLIKINYPSLSFTLLPFISHITMMKDADKLVMHNGVMHDAPLIKKLYGVQLDNIEDTFIMSSLFNPDRASPKGWVGQPKPHSIAAYAHRFNMVKIGHEDWQRFSWNMLDRCINDVMVGYKTHEYLIRESGQWDWRLSLQIEHSVARLQAEQEMYGVLFDREKAMEIRDKIDRELQVIERRVLSGIPKRVRQVGVTISKPFLKNGEYNKSVKDWIKGEVYDEE